MRTTEERSKRDAHNDDVWTVRPPSSDLRSLILSSPEPWHARLRQGAASGSSPPEAASFLRMQLFAVLFGVQFRRLLVMLGGMQGMAMRNLGVMRGRFVISRLVMFGGFAMMLGRMPVMLRGVLVMFVNLVFAHRRLPG